ncbi:MAG: hypothetical protein Q8876_06795 [Bacillota bacterium]|nr:hypothetical protein [Bacillota bacterium]
MQESEMVNKGIEYFRNQQFIQVQREVPFLSRCIDVVLLNKENYLISIEFKVSKWRHAIEQAKNHKLGADEAYICIPERKLTVELEKAIQEAGVGLFFFNQNAERVIYKVIEAPTKYENIPVFKDMLISNIQKINSLFSPPNPSGQTTGR